MRGRAVRLFFSLMVLTGCERDFDAKYQENLEQLNEEAREIEARVDQQLAEGAEADKVMQSAEEAEQSAQSGIEGAQ